MPLAAGKAIVLVVSILMPRDVPDINHMAKMPDWETCWKAAADFAQHDLSDDMRDKGALGLGAMCAYKEMPSEKN